MARWKQFSRTELLKKEAIDEKAKTKNRMQKFLEAAAQGKLWHNQEHTDPTEQEEILSDNFEEAKLKMNQKLRLNSAKKLADTSKLNSNRTERKDSLSEIDFDQLKPGKELNVNMDKKVKEMMWPWVKSPFNMNKFDNRFKAQEKLLHEQHDMIKDQQKLIEEMKFQQSQVAFKEQITLLEQIKAKQVCQF